mgnify:CR=1 FL=1
MKKMRNENLSLKIGGEICGDCKFFSFKFKKLKFEKFENLKILTHFNDKILTNFNFK